MLSPFHGKVNFTMPFLFTFPSLLSHTLVVPIVAKRNQVTQGMSDIVCEASQVRPFPSGNSPGNSLFSHTKGWEKDGHIIHIIGPI